MANTTISTYKGTTTINCDGCGEWQPVNYARGKEIVESEIKSFKERHKRCREK